MKGKRHIKTIITTYGEVVRKESEGKVNDVISELCKSNKIISIIPHNAGIKPIKLLYDIVLEEGVSSEQEQTRYLKTITMTVDEVTENEGGVVPEQKVNEAIDYICDNGGKIITILPHNIGVSPILVMYDIIYEAFKPI